MQWVVCKGFLIFKSDLIVLQIQIEVNIFLSTINKEGGLGLASSCVVYSVFGLSAIMIPQLLMNWIKFKWTMTLGFALQLFYVGLNGNIVNISTNT